MSDALRFQKLVAETKTRIREITVDELSAGVRPRLIDVREDSEFAAGHVPGALPISRGVLEGRIEAAVADTGAEIVLYCASGNRSALAAESLGRMGYTRVASLAGGIGAWVRAGLPVER